MAATQPTRTHSFRLGRKLAMVTIALALVAGAFTARAAASLAQTGSDYGWGSSVPPGRLEIPPPATPDPTATPD
ncbi:MAG: hypothetical protein M3Z28_12765, partial [Candidatus Dormibacteraeota bacterium]|nr:hypothetical protein [Candidatus Dormibacteraeota bacterium]